MKNNFLLTLFTFCIMWCVFTTTIYTFKHPNKTQTEVFLHIPKSFILNFD